jgi:hypothetical protein
LWCYNNPRGKEAGKELCDILVICEPHVIIVSVKEVALKDTGNPSVDFERWERKAVTASIKQIHGAERWLASATHVIRSDGSRGLALPSLKDRKVHRIAVAFGSRDKVPIGSGDDGKGYVHVMNERSFLEVLSELDAITDLVDYLAAKEACAAQGCAVLIDGSESNLLGWYLYHGRSFPGGHDFMIVGDNIWDEIRQKPEFKRRKEEDRESYYWDHFIELLSNPNAKSVGEAADQLTQVELALRAMARETRFSRRTLGKATHEFFQRAKAGQLRSRMLVGHSGVIYVLVYFPAGEPDEFRISELGARCFVARHKVGEGDTIVGIGISEHLTGSGSASDLIYMYVPHWSASDDKEAEKVKAEFGYFLKPRVQHRSSDEYPGAGKSVT